MCNSVRPAVSGTTSTPMNYLIDPGAGWQLNIELDHLRSTTSQAVIRVLKMTFARHGIPDVVVSDGSPINGHITSSPRHPQSNGKAESAVKTCKTLLKMSLLSKTEEYLALLDHQLTRHHPKGCWDIILGHCCLYLKSC